MKKDDFEFVRLVENERRAGPTLSSVSRHWRHEGECFLFVTPHDDDAVLGGALMMLAAAREKVPVHVAVVTDGAMGYCSMGEKDTIADVRRAETFSAYKMLRVKHRNIHWLGFPDCQLYQFTGRRAAGDGAPAAVHGFTGMQNAFTELLRRVRPTQIFMPTLTDLHPDHRLVHSEMLISCFHACGNIWPELGPSLPRPPYIHEIAVYCNFPAPPRLRIKAPRWAFLQKLRAIAEFRSQKQIKAAVESVRREGPLEYLRPIEFAMYHPSVYRDMFEEPPQLGMFR
jgi:LmbE family N-acetylglucosaminyl deacetylase